MTILPSGRRPWRPAAGTLVIVWIGGAAGALLRWGVDLVIPYAGGVPWGTLLVNVLGCAAMGWLVAEGERVSHPAWVRPGLGTGLLGGFTTFSIYSVQVVSLASSEPLAALGYLTLTPVLCVGATVLSAEITRRAGRR